MMCITMYHNRRFENNTQTSMFMIRLVYSRLSYHKIKVLHFINRESLLSNPSFFSSGDEILDLVLQYVFVHTRVCQELLLAIIAYYMNNKLYTLLNRLHQMNARKKSIVPIVQF